MEKQVGRKTIRIAHLHLHRATKHKTLIHLLQQHMIQVNVSLPASKNLHAKVLLTEIEQQWGSLNWTMASLKNTERVVICTLREEVLAAEVEWFEQLWEHSLPIDQAEELDPHIKRGKSKQVAIADGSA